MKTLLIEDDPHVRELLEGICVAHGLRVTSAPTAEAGLDVFLDGGVQLVLLDVFLPGMNGIALCRKMRAHPNGTDTVIVAVTSKTGPGALDEVLEAGADDYLAKPFTPEDVATRITIARRRAQGRARATADRRALDESRAEVAALVDTAPIALISVGADRRIADVRGGAWGAGLGISMNRFGEPLSAVLGDVPELDRALEGKIVSFQRTLNGTPVFVRFAPMRKGRGTVAVITAGTRALTGPIKAHSPGELCGMIGRSAPMLELFGSLKDIAAGDWTALIEGETGTGKELAARALHDLSPRNRGPFVAVNCAGLTSTLLQSQLFGHRRGAFTGAINDHVGVFEAASGGTLLLDEVGDISKEVQISLLRVLEERRIWRLGDTTPHAVDVRVVVATHRNLAALVAEGEFRADLLYRIRVARVAVPPLRDRGDDIVELARTFLARAAAAANRPVPALLPDAVAALRNHKWPGNVRELRAAMDFAIIRSSSGGDISRDRLPPEVSQPAEPQSAAVLDLPSDPREQLLAAIEAMDGNRAAAARLLGISRTTLYRRLQELGIDT